MAEQIKHLLKKRKILLANWGCADPDTFQCRDWIPYLKKTFGSLIVFSLRNYYYKYGRRALNKKFLEILEKEKPDYLIFGHRYDEISIDTILKIKKISPHTKTIIEFGDDDFRFDDWGRYYSLFFDYIFTPKKELEIYTKDKIKGAFFFISINPEFYRPLNLKKIYDVTFIGRPVADRYDYIKFLMDNGVKITLFGVGWESYPEFKDIYKGVLYGDEFIRVMNQSKINLNFSKTLYKKGEKGQFKGRVLEVGACNSFLLNEYTEMNPEFLNKQKEMNFKTKEELLQKIKYYLGNEKEREKISDVFYHHILENYSLDTVFTRNFLEIEKNPLKKEFPQFKFKTCYLTEADLSGSEIELKNKLVNADYVYFKKGNFIESPHKKFFHPYSLYISGKNIGCCDYNLCLSKIGNYLIFNSKKTFNTLDKKNFCNILNINQLIVKKDFFLKNKGEFQKIFRGGFSDILSEENLVFISIPLFNTQKIPKMDYNSFIEFFYPSFFDELVSKIWQKKFFNLYFFKLLSKSFSKKNFIRKYLYKRLFDKSNLNALKTFKK